MENQPQSDRVTKLETYRETDHCSIEALTEKVDDTLAIVQDIQQQLSKQKGFFAGVLFVLLPIWSMLTAVALSMWDKWTGPST